MQAVSSDYLKEIMQDAHTRTMELLAGLDEEQLIGPKLSIVNPLRWETGHVAWFTEKFILRELYGRQPLLANGDEIYDSIAVHHEARWDLPLLTTQDIKEYMETVLQDCLDLLPDGMATEEQSYIYQFCTYHEDMHTEAYTCTRQTLAYPRPAFANSALPEDANAGGLTGDVLIPGGEFMLGASEHTPFLFDNEKWAHRVFVDPFQIAKAPVTNKEYMEFVQDSGYQTEEFWTDEGWDWREKTNAGHPVYWDSPDGQGYRLRRYDENTAVPVNQPVIHVNWYEANAYCHWAGRRLPTEAEWNAAALGRLNVDGNTLDMQLRTYPWGEMPPAVNQANLDGKAGGCVDVAALSAGDSAFGCRQMLGNVWEWTATTFAPFPGFSADAYQAYSAPLFDETKVLKGGAWTTRSRMITGRYRNFYSPERRDVMAGFRTCAI